MVKGEKPVIIIEHLEEEFSIWLLLEYRHSSIIYNSRYLWFTNIPRRYHRIMARYGRVFSESIIELISRGVVKGNEAIILDPRAEKTLTYDDLLSHKYIIIGGILGDHPPRHRTEKLLSSRLKDVARRNIGDGQYSIDGTVYYVEYLWRNKGIHGYRYVDGVTIESGQGYIRLPFRYPIMNNKPLLAPGLIDYLVKGILPKEIREEILHPNKS
jgi:ribosome biogenesis SPOUT family RNA methylase Rps3